jgi:hypothetical protein
MRVLNVRPLLHRARQEPEHPDHSLAADQRHRASDLGLR